MGCAAVDEIDIVMVRGDTYALNFTHQDAAGAAVDITGWTLTMTVDPSDAPADATANLFSVTGSIVTALDGTFTMTPSAVNTAQTPGVYYHDIQATVGATIETIAAGKFTICQDVTK